MKVINTALNLLLLAGTALMLVLIILSGSTDHFPFNNFYWVRGNTSDISGAYSESAWTFWGVCEYGNFSNCQTGPAYPLSPVDNFHTSTNVPSDFVDNRDTYFYLSRFAFVFLLLGICFTGFALVIDILGFCFTAVDKIVIVLVVIALFFVAGGAALQTAVTVLARNAFTDDNLSAKVGVKSMGVMWGAVAAILLVFFNTCAANIANSYKKHIERVNQEKGYNNQSSYYPPAEETEGGALGDESSFTRTAPAAEKEDTGSGGIRFFRIKRNQKPSDEESV